MSKEKDQKAKFATAVKLQAIVKKQVLNRTPNNVAINEIVKFLPDPQKDNTASINAVKANASRKINQIKKDAKEIISDIKERSDKTIENYKETIATCQEKAKQDLAITDEAFDIYIKKVSTIVKGTEFAKEIQEIK